MTVREVVGRRVVTLEPCTRTVYHVIHLDQAMPEGSVE